MTQDFSGVPGSGLIDDYLARSGMFPPSGADSGRYDEVAGSDGAVAPGWADVATTVDALGRNGLRSLTGQVDRLLADDGVTYTPLEATPAQTDEGTAEARRWRLDPLPFMIDEPDWVKLEAGLIQRSTLLDAVLTDLYSERKLLGGGHLPPELVFGNPGYLRAAHGITIPGNHQLFLHAVDVYRGATGTFHALSDRTSAPSGAGYAMADRRVVGRVLPELFRRSAPRAIGAFFNALRSALESVAPGDGDEPRVVVLSPGTHSETAYDQAMLASLLGVPLVESADLVIRRGRLWMLSMGRFEPVDVVLRRVDPDWSDPLDLRPGSRLGVVGLTEACRRGTVTVVNTIGSGILETPALLPFLPQLARSILGETLKLESVPTFWCGDPHGRAAVLGRMDQMVLRPIGPGRSVFPALLSQADQDQWRARLRAEPAQWVGQEIAAFSEAPMAADGALAAGQVSLRLFSVAQGSGYVALPGGLGRVQGGTWAPGTETFSLAKDVWVRSSRDGASETSTDRIWLADGPVTPIDHPEFTTSPRVLEDLFWLGRYAERTEDTVRLLMAVRSKIDDFRYRTWHPASGCVPVLLDAVAAVTGVAAFPSEQEPTIRLTELLLDAQEPGTVAQSLTGLRDAARGVRDQLSQDTWIVLAATDRATAELAATIDDSAGPLASSLSAVLAGMLALSGLAAENMIRDPGWFLMDIGRRLERSQQLVALLRSTLTVGYPAAVESVVVEAVLAATESQVTYRRRYHGRYRIATAIELLLLDQANPRSLVYQVAACRAGLLALPDASATSRPQRLLEDIDAQLRRCRPAAIEHLDDGGMRPDLKSLLDSLYEALLEVGEAINAQHLRHPASMQPLGVLQLGELTPW